ncbi:MAG: ATP-binding protein [Colwellia sp.]|nr:ATP-binding protein [Colwellia sp.]
MKTNKIHLSIKRRLLLLSCLSTVMLNGVLLYFPFSLLTFLVSILITIVIISFGFRGINKRFMALETGLLNIKDNELSTVLPLHGNDEITRLERTYNQAVDKLRREKQSIYQRELLLDTVIQNSPLAMLLVSDDQHVIYSNFAARQLLSKGCDIEGANFDELLNQQDKSLQQVVETQRDGLFNLSMPTPDGEEELQTWLLSRGKFELNGMYHHLYLFKQLTRELNRQEVAVWKKVIRVISHELNNSLAPISSMTHSGQLLIKALNNNKLDLIFNTIEERVQHLSQFIKGYARFAKLPLPRREKVNWQMFMQTLLQQVEFEWDENLPTNNSYLDLAQLHQVLLNLIKNAHESGSKPCAISVRLRTINNGLQLDVLDRGEGMSDDVLKNALLPFYSTKATGSGIGLPLCREIIEAHDGFLNLVNRKGGGLKVAIWLP